MLPELRLLSEYPALAANREPTKRFPFLGEIEKSPFLEGRSYIIVALSKMGKTALTIRVVLDWTDQKILWITEESRRTWEDRSLKLKLEGKGTNVMLCHAMGMAVKDIERVVNQTEWDVLVIDTLKVLQIPDENDTAEVMKRLRPFLAKQQEEDKLTIFLHHSRKAGGAYGLAGAGSHAFIAAVDTELEIAPYKQTNQRRLSGRGRDDVEPLVYMLEDGKMTVVQKVGSISEQLMEVLTSEWQSTKELAEALDPEPKDAGRALKALAALGRIERNPPKGGQGTTFYWRRVDESIEGT